MIYLALLLVLTGLLILLLSVFSVSGRAGRGNAAKVSGSEVSRGIVNYSDPDSIEIAFPPDSAAEIPGIQEEDIFIDFSDEASDLPAIDLTDEILPEFEEPDNLFPATDEIQSFPEEPVTGSVKAVLFDDRSNMINYDSGGAVIDPTLSGYSSIKRVGSGILEAEKDGLNFKLGDSLYRFDFHKIFDVWSGANFIALPLKGSSSVKLFLLENPAGFPDMVESFFSEYVKG